MEKKSLVLELDVDSNWGSSTFPLCDLGQVVYHYRASGIVSIVQCLLLFRITYMKHIHIHTYILLYIYTHTHIYVYIYTYI